MDKRTLLAVVLSVVVLMVYQNFFVKPPVKTALDPPRQEASVSSRTAPQQTPPADPGKASAPAAIQTGAMGRIPAAEAVTGSERDVIVENPLYRAVFTTRGAALKSFQLKRYKTEVANSEDLVDIFMRLIGQGKPKPEGGPKPIELVHVLEGMPRPLSVSFPDSTVNIPDGGFYEADGSLLDMTKGMKPRRLTFTQSYPGELRIDKTFTFHPDKYSFELEVRVHNLGAAPLNQSGGLTWYQYVDPNAPTDSYGHDGPVSYIAKSMDRPEVSNMEADKTLGPDVSWGGFESKYFIAAMIPQNPSLTTFRMSKDANNLIAVGLKGPKNVIPPDQPGVFSYALYMGPKDYSILKSQNLGLENAIDFGDWLKWLAIPLLITLKFLYGYVGNYGIAIIILTILIKLIFWPLGNKSYKSMKEMQKLQPLMAALREKYKDDKTRLSQESMALYKTHKVNPLGGCLPMVVQIPVFFGLYKALLYAIELRHSPLFWWIQDLSAKDPYYITPIIMGGTMFIQQKMTPTGADPMQAKIMLFMPIIFTFMFLNFPSGLVIYWLFNNIISIGQQVYINKQPS
ncbi:MAG: membrane protein insertase YidC [Proteobacteria bacterium]|nr:membrane protein insertase YidC [Pseudomonadota bacterium]MBU4583021.1 membrane protein insertase YidC [Pseudomonadota bacterium]MCG2739902.1 membrane protein insertase YidC [Syntrophaceae bacterium]